MSDKGIFMVLAWNGMDRKRFGADRLEYLVNRKRKPAKPPLEGWEEISRIRPLTWAGREPAKVSAQMTFDFPRFPRPSRTETNRSGRPGRTFEWLLLHISFESQ